MLPEPPEEVIEAPAASGLILVVDDDLAVRGVARRLLERQGYAVVLAADGQEAVRQFAEYKDELSCVLLDFTMPSMDGRETLAAIREIKPEMPVVLASGYAEHDIAARLEGGGMDAFLQKPYSQQELAGAVASADEPSKAVRPVEAAPARRLVHSPYCFYTAEARSLVSDSIISHKDYAGMDFVRLKVERVRRRLAAQRVVNGAARGLLGGCCAAFVVLVAMSLFPALGSPLVPVLLLVAFGTLAGGAAGLLRYPSHEEAALAADERFALRERLISALEFEADPSPFAEALREDARQHAERIEPARGFPLVGKQGALPAWMWRTAAGAVLALCIAYLFLPEFDLLNYRARQAEAKAEEARRTEQAERIRELLPPLAELDLGEPGTLDALEGELKKMAEELEAGRMDEREAVSEMMDLAEKMREEARKIRGAGVQPKRADSMPSSEETRQRAKALENNNFTDAANAVSELGKKIEAGEMNAASLQALQHDLAELSEALGVESELGKEMAEFAKSLGQCKGMNGEQLKQALASGQLSAARLKEIERMLKQLDKMELAYAKMGQCANGMCQNAGMGDLKGAGQLWADSKNGNLGMGIGSQVDLSAGARINELTRDDVELTPEFVSGMMTPGQLLLGAEEEAAPDAAGAAARVQRLEGALLQLQGEAEQALSQEGIPPGARESVRNYFGLMEAQEEPAAAAGGAS